MLDPPPAVSTSGSNTLSFSFLLACLLGQPSLFLYLFFSTDKGKCKHSPRAREGALVREFGSAQERDEARGRQLLSLSLSLPSSPSSSTFSCSSSSSSSPSCARNLSLSLALCLFVCPFLFCNLVHPLLPPEHPDPQSSCSSRLLSPRPRINCPEL